MASVNMEKEGLLKQLEFFKEKCMFMYSTCCISVLGSYLELCSTFYIQMFFCYLPKLYATGIKIRSLVTDRHPATRKHMETHEPGISHFFDIWHISKSKQFYWPIRVALIF